MRRGGALLVIALVSAACEGNRSKLDEPLRGGASPASPASAAPPASGACDDALLQPQIDKAVAASQAYFETLAASAASWSADCEKVRGYLVALEPAGDAFVKAMTETSSWARTLSPPCRARLDVLAAANPVTNKLEQQTPAVEAKVMPILEACKDHPGFRDAMKRGLRLLRKQR